MSDHRRGCPLFTHPSQRLPGHPIDCRCDGPARAALTRALGLDSSGGAVVIRSTPAALADNLINELRAQGFDIVSAPRRERTSAGGSGS